MTATPIQVGDRVRILVGKLPCSEFRPFAGSSGTVTRIWPGVRFSIHIQLDHGVRLVYHQGEVELTQERQ